MRKFLLIVSFFVTAPFIILLGSVYLLFLSSNPHGAVGILFSSPAQNVAYAALPTNDTLFEMEVVQQDARTELVKQFFAKYDSPLEEFAANIVDASDKYGVDFRLIPAIAMQESNLCKRIPKDSHNCWGFGIYGEKITRFESYPQAIEIVTKTLSKKYKEQGLDSPDEIMTKYTPSSNGSWAYGVSHFMDQLQ